MYNVNRDKIDNILTHMGKTLNTVATYRDMTKEQFLENQVIILAVERALHVAIESIVDVGNIIIDGFIMRDPGSYIDIIEILEDEGVLPTTEAESLKQVVSYRKVLVHEFYNVDNSALYQLFVEEYAALINFGEYINTYLKKELD